MTLLFGGASELTIRRIDRRTLLRRVALGGAGLCLSGSLPVLSAGPRGATKVPEASGAAGSSVEELAQRIRRVAPDRIYRLGAKLLSAGATPHELLAASFLAGVRDIRPHGPGGKFHAVLMVESAFQLLEASSETEARRIALWTLWDFKRCQARDVSEEDDWELPAAPAVSFGGESAARREFIAGMEAWDVERAERGLIGLIPFHDRASLFELLWPYGARCYGDFGHKVLYCVHAERTLARIGWRHARPVLRSLVRGLLFLDDGKRRTESWDAAGERVLRMDAVPSTVGSNGAAARLGSPARSLELLRELRGRSVADSQGRIIAAIGAGLNSPTLWDGLRLHGAEVFHRRSAADERRHLPVHPVTELNAFRHLARVTANPKMKLLALLQAAGFIARLREDMARARGPLRDRRVDDLAHPSAAGESGTPDLAGVFAEPNEGAAWANIEAHGVAPYLAAARRHLLRAASQDHQYKFVAALHEESRATHRSLRARFLAPSISYIPAGRDAESEMSRRSRHALGIRR
ncbi:hypothetical protein ABI59_17160 [Acidobacteria bacterium Mor1]|nr:hypothetical protein ABI59_17160 [Acidobacteria bacterium Mor1]